MANLDAEIAESRKRKLRDPSSTVCPNCESQSTSSFEMASTQGTSTGSFSAGSYTLGGGATVTQGRMANQSMLASRTRPPEKPGGRLGLMIVAFFLLLIVLLKIITWAMELAAGMMIVAIIVPIAGIAAALYAPERKRLQPLLEKYNKDYAAWQRSWVCLQCGHTWRRVRT